MRYINTLSSVIGLIVVFNHRYTQIEWVWEGPSTFYILIFNTITYSSSTTATTRKELEGSANNRLSVSQEPKQRNYGHKYVQ
jgi:hypothetical protein